MTVVQYGRNGLDVFVKGAPEIILQRCTQIRDRDATRELTDVDRKRAHDAYEVMA
jgi:Ca2+-transporting ATPase